MAKIKTHHLKIITDKWLYLEDGGQGKTITNDAKEMVRLLQLNWQLGNRRVFYKDSGGKIDEIVLRDGKFSHFLDGDERIVNQINGIMKRSFLK